MKRAFLVNIVLLIFINILVKPFYVLVIDVSVQNTIGPASYGIFFSLFNFCYLFQVIADMGIQNFNSKRIAEKRSLAKEYIPRILGLKICLSIGFIVAIMILGAILQYPQNYFYFLLILGCNQVLLTFILYGRSNLSALGFYRIDALLSALDKLLLIFILAYLLWFHPNAAAFSLEWFVWSQTLSLGLTGIFVFTILYGKFPFSLPKFSLGFSKELIRKTWPYASVIILMTAYTRMDGVMIERLLVDGANQAGIYAAAYRLLDASNMLAYLFAVLLLPMFSNLLSRNKEIHSLLGMSYRFLLLICLIIVFACFFQRNEIMVFLYPDEADPYYGIILGVLIISFIAISMSYVFGTLLTAAGKIFLLNKVFIAGIVLNLLLNIALIPPYKALGAAIATVFTQYFVMFGQIYYVNKLFPIDFVPRQALIQIGFILVAGIIFFVFATILDNTWWLSIVLASMSTILVSLLIKFIDIAALLKILAVKE